MFGWREKDVVIVIVGKGGAETQSGTRMGKNASAGSFDLLARNNTLW